MPRNTLKLNPTAAENFIDKFYQSEGFGPIRAAQKADNLTVRLVQEAYEAGWSAHVNKTFKEMQQNVGETLTTLANKACAEQKKS